MAKYVVTAKCHGFRGKLWIKGEVVDINPADKPPKWFKPLTGTAKAKTAEELAAEKKAAADQKAADEKLAKEQIEADEKKAAKDKADNKAKHK